VRCEFGADGEAALGAVGGLGEDGEAARAARPRRAGTRPAWDAARLARVRLPVHTRSVVGREILAGWDAGVLCLLPIVSALLLVNGCPRDALAPATTPVDAPATPPEAATVEEPSPAADADVEPVDGDPAEVTADADEGMSPVASAGADGLRAKDVWEDAGAEPIASPPPIRSYLTVTTRPWTEVFLDGRWVRHTPMMNYEVTPGAHTIRLVNEEAGVDDTIEIAVEAGERLFVRRIYEEEQQ